MPSRHGDRVDAVGARLAIGAGAREAVLERAAADVDVDARVEDDVDPGRPPGVLDGGQEARVHRRVAQATGGVVGVLEVAPHRAGGEQALDEGVGLEAVARLAVGRHRHVDRRDDARERGEGRLGGDVPAVGVPERLGQPDAGRRQRGQPAPSAFALATSQALAPRAASRGDAGRAAHRRARGGRSWGQLRG